jgi:hypothetical protein
MLQHRRFFPLPKCERFMVGEGSRTLLRDAYPANPGWVVPLDQYSSSRLHHLPPATRVRPLARAFPSNLQLHWEWKNVRR